MIFDRASTLGEILGHRQARNVVQRFLPGIINSPSVRKMSDKTLGDLAAARRPYGPEDLSIERFWQALAEISGDDPNPEPPALSPRLDYEDDSVRRSSASLSVGGSLSVWGMVELEILGPDHGNPYIDVDVRATFESAGARASVNGFYDGEGRYRVRFQPTRPGRWAFIVESTARSMDGLFGYVDVGPAVDGSHGPVRVADTFHFRHADGTRFTPVGTTAYVWTHQERRLEEETLVTLAASPFTKIRMSIFPKAYRFNTNEPDLFPFVGSPDDGWDFTRFNPEYFDHLERRITDLEALGIQADLILFHPYDRWSFSDMGSAADDRFVRYVVRRLSAFASVWWSLANEYDLIWSKEIADWERLAGIIREEDPVSHLTSIHNCFTMYDHSKPWVTHASVQRVDTYRTAEEVDTWRNRWGKPVVVDECGYEGDVDQGWGNLTGEELVRRSWEGAIRGGYIGHGETYLNDAEELWWSKGGRLVGSSPARIGFLREVIAAMPGQSLEPTDSDWDVPWADCGEGVRIAYFGFNRPRFRTIAPTSDSEYLVDVIDTWNMTVSRLDGAFSGTFDVPLPARPFMALRLAPVPAATARDGIA